MVIADETAAHPIARRCNSNNKRTARPAMRNGARRRRIAPNKSRPRARGHATTCGCSRRRYDFQKKTTRKYIQLAASR